MPLIINSDASLQFANDNVPLSEVTLFFSRIMTDMTVLSTLNVDYSAATDETIPDGLTPSAVTLWNERYREVLTATQDSKQRKLFIQVYNLIVGLLNLTETVPDSRTYVVAQLNSIFTQFNCSTCLDFVTAATSV